MIAALYLLMLVGSLMSFFAFHEVAKVARSTHDRSARPAVTGFFTYFGDALTLIQSKHVGSRTVSVFWGGVALFMISLAIFTSISVEDTFGSL